MRRGPTGERLGFAERLVAARKRRGLRQLDAAREIGVSRETLARIEVDYVASDRTRAKVRAWLQAQEAAAAAEAAALRRRRASERSDGGRPRGPSLRLAARLAVRRRAKRALRAAGKPKTEGRKPRR